MAEDFYIFQRGERKNFYVQFRDPRTGKLGNARSSGKSSEAAALRWAKNELRDMVEREGKRPVSSMSLGDWARPFFGDSCAYLKRRRTEGKSYSAQYVRTCEDYIGRYIVPDRIADIPLCELRRRDILDWRQRLVDNQGARRTAQRALQVLKVVLNEAVYNELIEYSPASRVAMPVYEKKERQAISLDSLALLLAPERYTEPRHWLATVTAAFTGMRASEVRALEWPALDFDRRLIYVTQAFKDQTSRLGPPKSGKPRVAPMPEGLATLLLEWKKHAKSRWVFGFSENRPLGYKEWHYSVTKAAKAAGCEGATIHYLRHTLNTYLVGAGVDQAIVRASFGWSGVEIQGNYTHADKFDYSAQARAIDRIIKIGGKNESDTEPDGGRGAPEAV